MTGEPKKRRKRTIEALDHVNLRTINLDKLKDFYAHALGLSVAKIVSAQRGYWLGSDGKVMLHIIEADRTDRSESPQIEHFAFRATGLWHVMLRLDEMGIAYNIQLDPQRSLVQLNLRDPDDNRIHLDFAIEEHETGMAPAKVSLR